MGEGRMGYRRLVSRKHWEILVKYMEKYPVLALSCARSREEVDDAKKLWEKIAHSLNKVDGKVYKTGLQWSRYWADSKFKIRRKYTCQRQCESSGNACSVRLSPFEQRIIKILTDDDGNLIRPSALSHVSLLQESVGELLKSSNRCSDESDNDRTSQVNDSETVIEFEDVKPNLTQDPIQLDRNAMTFENTMPYDNTVHFDNTMQFDKDRRQFDKKSIEDLRRELLEFELKKQRELFEIEKRERKEKHEMEISIMRLRKQLLMKQIDS